MGENEKKSLSTVFETARLLDKRREYYHSLIYK